MEGKRWIRRETEEKPWLGEERDNKPWMRGLNRRREKLMERIEYEKAVAEGKPFEWPCILDSRGRIKKIPLLPIRFIGKSYLDEVDEARRKAAAEDYDGLNENLDPVVGSVQSSQFYSSVNLFQDGLEEDKNNLAEEENKMEESKKRKNGKEEESKKRKNAKKEKDKKKKICKESKKKKMALQPDGGAIRRCDQLQLLS